MLHARVKEAEALRGQLEELRKELKRKPQAVEPQSDVEASVEPVDGVNVIVQAVDGLEGDALLDLSDRLKARHAPAFVVLGSATGDGKVSLVANADADVAERISAVDVIRGAAPIVGGGGGGRPTMARAGGKDPERLARRARRGAPSRRRSALLTAMKALALDFGRARTGVAVSDATGMLARPVCVVERAAEPAGLDRLVELVDEHAPEVVVVGMPLTLRGAVRGAGDRHRGRSSPSCATGSRSRSRRGTSGSRRRWRSRPQSRAPEDALAAAHLLQSWLDRQGG